MSLPSSPRFPPIEPYASGMLDVGGGHTIYWEACGNPAGEAALYLHGGPGGGCGTGARRFFDPGRYRIVLLDQRGSGRSRPLASELTTNLAENTTGHLIADIEELRRHLGVDTWTILGVSWGTTLALAYARAHRDRVRAMVLALVTTTSRREVAWMTQGVAPIFPREWERFSSAVPSHLAHLPLVDAYAELLADPDAAVREHAAREWCAWEDAHVSLAPDFAPNPQFQDAEFRFRFARLVTHYWRHAAFLDDEILIRDSGYLIDLPGVLIHGRFDVSGPLETAWRLHRAWPSSQLVILDDVGHGAGESFPGAVTAALSGLPRR